MLIGSPNAIIGGSARGVAFDLWATEVAFDFLRKIDPALRDVKLDLAKTYEGSFIEKARATLGLE